MPVAIALGGPGAVFWMIFIAFFGMALKYSEVVLGVFYREKNAVGEFVGGPTYYMKKGIKNKKLGAFLASFFAIAIVIEIIPSTMVQGNSVASTIEDTFNIAPWITGVVVAIVTALVVFGGVKRIASVTEIIVPFMVFFYLLFGFIIIIMNITAIPEIVMLVIKKAFKPDAAVGGGVGAALAITIRWGFARGVYSNEAGMGTSPIAHAAAKTDHPVRQGFWGIAEIIVDTVIICSTTAFVVLLSGVYDTEEAQVNPGALTARAFGEAFGSWGSKLVSISLIFFVISTIIVIIFYGSRMAEYLFGLWAGKVMKFVYVIAIVLGALSLGNTVWSLLDLTLAFVLIPNIIAVVLLAPKVKELTIDFFKNVKPND